MSSIGKVLIVLALAVCNLAPAAAQRTLRVATYNIDLSQRTSGGLIDRLSMPDFQDAKNVAEVIQRINPDVILLNEFDYDAEGKAVGLFQRNYLAVSQNGLKPTHYAYVYLPTPLAASPTNSAMNTGVQPEEELKDPASDVDFDNDGKTDGPADAFGFGQYPGRYGFVVLSKYPIRTKEARTFQKFLWKDMPRSQMPRDWYDVREQAILRLSSKNHADVPIEVGDRVIHLLAAHPTPPAFDKRPYWNRRRNFDEIRVWADYITPGASDYLYDDQGRKGGLTPDASFVIVGDLNADPDEGNRWRVNDVTAIGRLIDHPRVHDVVPKAPDWPKNGAGDADDTAPFAGNLRVDYVLPSKDLTVMGSAVFWPAQSDPQYRAVKTSDHRLVYVDLRVE